MRSPELWLPPVRPAGGIDNLYDKTISLICTKGFGLLYGRGMNIELKKVPMYAYTLPY